MPPTKSKISDHFEPQFINVTNSVFLDRNARTSVRSQVMKEYHRRRIQNQDGGLVNIPEPARPMAPPTAKEQTQKFRLDKKRAFQAWVPVVLEEFGAENTKSILESRSKVKKPLKIFAHKVRDSSQMPTGTTIPSNPAISEINRKAHAEEQFIVLHRLLNSLNLITANSIGKSPASESMDPFDSLSLLLDSRTQILLHHYCK